MIVSDRPGRRFLLPAVVAYNAQFSLLPFCSNQSALFLLGRLPLPHSLLAVSSPSGIFWRWNHLSGQVDREI